MIFRDGLGVLMQGDEIENLEDAEAFDEVRGHHLGLDGAQADDLEDRDAAKFKHSKGA